MEAFRSWRKHGAYWQRLLVAGLVIGLIFGGWIGLAVWALSFHAKGALTAGAVSAAVMGLATILSSRRSKGAASDENA